MSNGSMRLPLYNHRIDLFPAIINSNVTQHLDLPGLIVNFNQSHMGAARVGQSVVQLSIRVRQTPRGNSEHCGSAQRGLDIFWKNQGVIHRSPANCVYRNSLLRERLYEDESICNVEV